MGQSFICTLGFSQHRLAGLRDPPFSSRRNRAYPAQDSTGSRLLTYLTAGGRVTTTDVLINPLQLVGACMEAGASK